MTCFLLKWSLSLTWKLECEWGDFPVESQAANLILCCELDPPMLFKFGCLGNQILFFQHLNNFMLEKRLNANNLIHILECSSYKVLRTSIKTGSLGQECV